MRFTRCCLVAVAACALLAGAAHADVELITNGGFETGDFTGWTVTDLPGGSGSFYVVGPGLTPVSGFPSVGPHTGNFYAVSDQPGPGTHALSQAFNVPGPAASVILSFDMFVNDQSGSGPVVDPIGLDHNVNANQHGRVDIMAPGAPPFDTGAGVLANYYLGIDPFATNPNPYMHYQFDITALVGAGGTYVIRFAEVDNLWYFNMGVDNVSVDYTRIPTPASAVLGLLGLGAIGSIRRRFA